MLPKAQTLVDDIKRDLARPIVEYIEREQMSGVEASKFFGVPRPKITRLLSGRLDTLSVTYLVRMAARIKLRPRVTFR